ncbi:hypothetical protein GF336_07160 [Candidatus Woesearchaeota archaeon]|nr:hypothetical protein [Candidatus Woesearchaeota archaeon]
MLKMQKELYSVKKKIKPWIKNKGVVDVLIFGSSQRGKYKPNDIDLCILVKEKDEKRSLNLVDSLGKQTDSFKIKSQINILTLSEFIEGNSLAKTLMLEGLSIKNNKPLHKIMGFDSRSLFEYSLKKFSSSKRVKFHYLLKGRYNSKGILQEAGGKILGTGTIMVPTAKEDLLKEIFDQWQVDYNINRILLS